MTRRKKQPDAPCENGEPSSAGVRLTPAEVEQLLLDFQEANERVDSLGRAIEKRDALRQELRLATLKVRQLRGQLRDVEIDVATRCRRAARKEGE